MKVFQKDADKKLWLALAILLSTVVISTSTYGSELDVDIRSRSILQDGDQETSFTTAISDCSKVTAITYRAGNNNGVTSPSDAQRIPGTTTGCELHFSGIGIGRYDPQVILNLNDGTTYEHQESFHPENNPPQIDLEEVGFNLFNGRQNLTIAIHASDDVDITSLSFTVTGLRASDLRASGGVVAQVQGQAFARTLTPQKIHPTSENQDFFTFSLPVTSELDSAAIAHDGLVIVNASVIDASGNQGSLSRIVFTGDDVVEEASDLQTSPGNIIFTNLLETAVITPSVAFRFRGITPLPGLGTGVTYESSHPSLIAVTAGGTVYPLAETGTEQVSVKVTYPDLEPVIVPVEVDLTKKLATLHVNSGVNSQGQWVLERLNSFFTLPPVIAVFDDGSESEIGSQFPLSYTLAPQAAGIIQFNPESGAKAKAIVPDSAPLALAISLQYQPEIGVTLPIIAHDAIPEISFALPDRFQAGNILELQTEAWDDVGIEEIRFLMNGSEIGSLGMPPYLLTMDITEELIGETYREADCDVRKLAAKLGRKRCECNTVILCDDIEPVKVVEYETRKSALQEEIKSMEKILEELKECRKALPKHVKLGDLPQEDHFRQLGTKSKYFIDTIKIIAYRAETAMVNIARQTMSHADEARKFVASLYATAADIQPDLEAKTLTVRLHQPANRSSAITIEKLCAELNETKTTFPGTNLRLVYELIT